MKLKSLSLMNYRVAERQDWHFEADVVSITGANGTGKTNILDAIHYMCLTRSYFNQQDQQLVRFGEDFFNLQAQIMEEEAENKLFCAWQGGKKVLRKNGVVYDRLADHIGLFPVVMIAPTDLDLIYEGSEARRRFADMLLSQTDHAYLLALMRYNKILQQKQALLRQYKQEGRVDITLLDVLDMQLLPLNVELYSKRVAWLDQYNPLFEALYRSISGDREQVGIRYESSFNALEPALAMQQAGKDDLASGRCSVGIHRDDLLFTINGHPVKRFGSQGQQKSFLISLKLAQSIYLSEVMGKKPFLLLDDIFEKLDGQRVSSLLRLVQEERFGQIFLTDTDKKRVEAIFRPHNTAVQYIEL
ncbi:MAG: DNA replication and repair protein RecF [Sphingobacteriaceae bacterium]|nr:DNA replication and repair protein RecF [Sphingobacteriaceae bacterium]